MRLLPKRNNHDCRGLTQGETQADGRRHRCGDHQHLPLWHLSTNPRGDSRRSRRVREVMAYMLKLDRRSFVIAGAAAGAGLALGFNLPFAPDVACAEDSAPEIDAWV